MRTSGPQIDPSPIAHILTFMMYDMRCFKEQHGEESDQSPGPEIIKTDPSTACENESITFSTLLCTLTELCHQRPYYKM